MNLLISLLLIFTSYCYGENTEVPGKKSRLADKVQKKAVAYLKKEKGLIFFGDHQAMLNEIKMLGLAFQYRKPVDIKKGRELLVSAMDRLLLEINAEKEIHPFLKQYPFLPKNITIDIFLQNPDGTTLPPGVLRILSASNGILKYKIDDQKTGTLHTVYEETYSDAVKKIALANGTLSPEEARQLDDDQDSFNNRSIGTSFSPFHPNEIANHTEDIDLKNFKTKQWLLTFEKLLGDPPYRLEMSRVSEIAHIFHPQPTPSSKQILEMALSKKSLIFNVHETGFLPGEKVTWRIYSNKPTLFTEASGYPRPLILTKKTGEKLLEAELVRLKPTTYYLTISSIQPEEEFKLIYTFEGQKTESILKGPIEKRFSPVIKDKTGGITEVEIQLKDQTSYKIELPWGTELLKYQSTSPKKNPEKQIQMI